VIQSSWRQLLNIAYGVPLAELALPILHSFNDTYHKIADHIYLFAYQSEVEPVIRYCGFVWVASDGAAEWVFTGNARADDEVNIRPPPELLPASDITSYIAIAGYGRDLDPKNFQDYTIGQHLVAFGDFRYYYRKVVPADTDYPIAIEVDRRPWKNMRA
jgi:hypothetical protein